MVVEKSRPSHEYSPVTPNNTAPPETNETNGLSSSALDRSLTEELEEPMKIEEDLKDDTKLSRKFSPKGSRTPLKRNWKGGDSNLGGVRRNEIGKFVSSPLIGAPVLPNSAIGNDAVGRNIIRARGISGMKCPDCGKSFVSQGGWEYHTSQKVCTARKKRKEDKKRSPSPKKKKRPPPSDGEVDEDNFEDHSMTQKRTRTRGRGSAKKSSSEVAKGLLDCLKQSRVSKKNNNMQKGFYDSVWSALGFKADGAAKAPQIKALKINGFSDVVEPPKPVNPPDLHIPLLIPWIQKLKLKIYSGDTEDDCYLCRDGGDLMCCDYCSKVVHESCWKQIGGFSQENLDGVVNEDVLLCDTCCIGVIDNLVASRNGNVVIGKDGYTAHAWRKDCKKWARDTQEYEAYEKERAKIMKAQERGGASAQKTKKPSMPKKVEVPENQQDNEDKSDEDKIPYTPASSKKGTPKSKSKSKSTKSKPKPKQTPDTMVRSVKQATSRLTRPQREAMVDEVCKGFYDPILTSDLSLESCPTGGPGGIMCCAKCSEGYIKLLDEGGTGLEGQVERVDFVKSWLAKEEEVLKKMEAEKKGREGGENEL